jgi:hypothetical protein
MNTQQITRTATVVTTVVMAASVVATAPAFAEHPADGHPADGRRTGTGATTSWTIPFEAIGGRTVAEYLADHQARNFPAAQL